jgi:hypothetical protein
MLEVLIIKNMLLQISFNNSVYSLKNQKDLQQFYMQDTNVLQSFYVIYCTTPDDGSAKPETCSS